MRDGAAGHEHAVEDKSLDLDDLIDSPSRRELRLDEVKPVVSAFNRFCRVTHRVHPFLEVDELLELVQQPNNADGAGEVQALVLRLAGKSSS